MTRCKTGQVTQKLGRNNDNKRFPTALWPNFIKFRRPFGDEGVDESFTKSVTSVLNT